MDDRARAVIAQQCRDQQIAEAATPEFEAMMRGEIVKMISENPKIAIEAARSIGFQVIPQREDEDDS